MTRTCRAAVLEEVNAPLVVRDLEIPELMEGQVLVRLSCSGICQSQLNEWRGRKGPDRFLPHTLGHEGAGLVEAVGPGVTRVKLGDQVVVSWIKGPGRDAPSTRYRAGDVAINSGAVSTFMTAAVVSENRLTPVADLPMEVAALLGCAVPTGCGIVLNELKPEAGRPLVVWGAGGIGLAAVMAAAAVGCRPVIAVDVLPEKLKLAQECGATHLVDGRDNPIGAIRAITGGQGADYGVECSGAVAAMEMGFEATRRGGHFVIAGNAPSGTTIRLDPFELIAGKKITGSWGGASRPDADIPRYIQWYREGRLPVGKLIRHRLPLERVNEALALMESGCAGRVLIEMTDNTSGGTI